MSKKNIPAPDFMNMAAELIKSMPNDVAGRAMAHFKGSFLKQGFTDTSFIPWPNRLDDQTFGVSHKLLRKTNALMDSLTIEEATRDRVVISAGKGLSYAAIHNNGGTIKVKVTTKMRKYFWFIYLSLTKGYANGRTPPDHILKWKKMALTKKKTLVIRIPKRQFIGQSETLLKNIDAAIVASILKTFKENSKPV